MKTTIDIPETVLQEAMRHAKVKTKREAVLKALDEFNRRSAMAELVKYSGTASELMSVEQLMELRAADQSLHSKRSK